MKLSQPRRTNVDLSLLTAFAIAVSLLSVWASAYAEPPKSERRYDQGPLKHNEFRKDAEDAIPGRAKTMARVMYSYRTQIERKGPERFQVQLTSLDAYSVFLPKESWWSYRNSIALLDHEQGHFDIAEITARRLELAVRQAIKKGQSIGGFGKTLKQANAELSKKLQRVIDIANEQSVEENADYDRKTLHGARVGSQAEYRRIQKLTLEKLAKQLDRISRNDAKSAKSK